MVWTVLACAMALAASSALAQEATPAVSDPALDRYYSANALYNKKLHVLAVREYETFLKQCPEHPKAEAARYGHALCLVALGRHAEAEPVLARLAQDGKVGERSHLTLLRGQCLLRMGKLDESRAAFAEAAGSDVKAHQPAALAGLTEVAFLRGKWQETIEWASKLTALDSQSPWSLRAAYQAAYAQHELGRNEDAAKALGDLLPRLAGMDPVLNGQAALLLGECHRSLGQLAEAARCYAQAQTNLQGDASAEVLFRMGVVHLGLGDPLAAEAAFRKTIDLKPPPALAEQARLYLGRALVEKGSPEYAIQTLQGFVQGGRKDAVAAEAALWYARALVRQRKPSDAIGVLSRAVQQHADNPLAADMHFECGNLYMDAKSYDKAEACFATVIQSFPAWPQTNDVLRLDAACLHHLRRYADSLKRCDDFLGRFPSDRHAGEVSFLRAENLFLLDRVDDAVPVYRALLGSEGSNTVDAVTLRLTMIHYRTNAWRQALATGEPLLNRLPQPGGLYASLPFLLGDAAFRIEDWERARAYLAAFEKGADAQAENLDTAVVEMGVAAAKLAQTNAALERFQTLVKRFPKSRHVPLALAETGRLAYESGDLAAARAALERLLADFRDAPQRVSALYYLGWIARGQDKADEAGRYFDELAKQYPKDPLASDAALQRGLAWLAVERYEEAAAAFDDLLKRFSDHARADLALFSKGVALARQQQWQPAAGAFRQYLERHPKGDLADRALYELAWCEKGQQRPNDAAARYEALLATHPDSSLALKARAELAELRFDAKDFERTIAELKQALEQAKDAALREETLYRLGSAQFSKGDFAACAGTFELFAAEFPKSSLAPSAQFQAGESRMKLGDLQAARDRFAAAVQAAESMPDTGSARKPKTPAKRGEKPRAEKAVSDTKVHEAALLRLAEVQGLLEAWKESADTAAQFQRTYPQSPYARLAAFSRGWALENLGQYESAIEAFRSVVQRNERDDTSARCQFHLGECLYGLKRHDEALMELVKVEAVYRNEAWTPKALLEMGRVLEAKGEKDKAQDQFKALIRRYPKHDAAAIAKERLDAVRKSL